MTTPPLDPVTAQQTLDVLQRIQDKVLLEMWTTLMLVAGMMSVLLAQTCHLFGWRRIAAVFVGVFGYTMTWVPAAIAPYLGYFIILVAVASILRDSMGVDSISTKRAPVRQVNT